MAELKRCPFCGLPGYLESQFGREWWVQCECGHSTGIVHPRPIEAEEEWNRRASIGDTPAPQSTEGVPPSVEAQEREAWRAWGAGELEYASWLPIHARGVTDRDGQTFSGNTPLVSGDSEANKEKG